MDFPADHSDSPNHQPPTPSAHGELSPSLLLPPQRELFLVVQQYIRERLSDPDLSPSTIACAHHISLRHLHRLFRLHGLTVAAWIRRQRLEGCRRDLTDLAKFAQPIQSIAVRWGFTDNAHFSRVFRAAYGYPPSHLRRETETRWYEQLISRFGPVHPFHALEPQESHEPVASQRIA
ncbi:AraC family transcriptional regulator [Streptomyces xiamenensis]|uniref:AraC family transcriptional regulator n=1 Tax=Streptomyces xiamenensis TaxID=408015 RepID=A0A0F7CP01_9ACTN|nr:MULTISPECIES: helix-turn-helix domain-containing protein [Streptomyces]AKG43801.1 AraC family transcriptional regulator [Streptomyces xiamenensis]